MRSLRVNDQKSLKALARRLRADVAPLPAEEKAVAAILRAVALRGDTALLSYARRFDGFKGGAKDLFVKRSELKAAYAAVDRDFIRAVETVIANIRAYQARLKPRSWRAHLRPGVLLGQVARPIQRVGIYVPGGAAPLVSTVLMCAVPAAAVISEALVALVLAEALLEKTGGDSMREILPRLRSLKK